MPSAAARLISHLCFIQTLFLQRCNALQNCKWPSPFWCPSNLFQPLPLVLRIQASVPKGKRSQLAARLFLLCPFSVGSFLYCKPVPCLLFSCRTAVSLRVPGLLSLPCLSVPYSRCFGSVSLFLRRFGCSLSLSVHVYVCSILLHVWMGCLSPLVAWRPLLLFLIPFPLFF